ncbi:hypothetical protein BU16DRAFT_466581, partial [Lophium mytilinum]
DLFIYGWPSRGGVIVLEDAGTVDFDFLGLDRLRPPQKRYEDSTQEDAFCQRLLLLGAKWWDSRARFSLLLDAKLYEAGCRDALEEGTEPEPTASERFWVCVAWPSSGGLVMAEYDTTLPGFSKDADRFVPGDVARLRLCASMDERAAMLLERCGGKVFRDVSEYSGKACINSWVLKTAGDHGLLQETWH